MLGATLSGLFTMSRAWSAVFKIFETNPRRAGNLRVPMPKLRLPRRAVAATAILGFAAIGLAGCMTAREETRGAQPSPAVISQIREVDLSARFPERQTASDGIVATGMARGESYYGDDNSGTLGARSRPPPPEDPATTGALTPGTPAPAGGPGYEMNFENAPVATVAKAILGDILGVGYTIDPRVQATVSLSYGPSRSEEGHPLRV